MAGLRLVMRSVVLISLLVSVHQSAAGSGASTALTGLVQIPQTRSTSTLSVMLRAASGEVLAFRTQNGRVVEGVPPARAELPYLVLHRNGALTGPDEHTLIVEVTGIRVPLGGVTVTLALMTQHRDPDVRDGAAGRILVDRQSQWVGGGRWTARTDGSASFARVFTETVASGAEEIATPTDYFRIEVSVDGITPGASPTQALGADYAFLMEDQWVVDLPEVGEESPGAAPDELIVHYSDMVPFEQDVREPASRLRRGDVPRFVGQELVPRMVDAFRLQTDGWGFPWPAAWSSLRPEDGVERLSVALTDGQTWYHGAAPMTGHSMISLNVSGRASQHYLDYDILIDGLMSTFHHELFHNLQRGLRQDHGGDGALGVQDDAWEFFSEGTAVLASSVAQPTVHFARTGTPRHYAANAKLFLTWRSFGYEKMPPPAAAMFWRFLYEQCGGMADGVEDPPAGMQVIRRALTALYSGRIVDVVTSTGLVEHLPAIMDRSLAGSSCPFQSHADALVQLARAMNALRLEGGRCVAPGMPSGCGFYDPNSVYVDPPVTTITYRGTDERNPIRIGSNLGTAFVDVVLAPRVDGRSLMIEFQGAPSAEPTFRVQVWKLIDAGPGRRPRRIPAQALAPELLTDPDGDGQLVYTLPASDVAAFNRLGLIITRIDAKESSEPIDEYTVRLHPGADGTDWGSGSHFVRTDGG